MISGICLTKEIEAAHFLLKYKGKPEGVHGHTWKIEVFFEGELNDEDYLLDFIEVENYFDSINKNFNHSCFNDFPYFKTKSPTTENIAIYYFNEFQKFVQSYKFVKLTRVNVWEGRNNFAFYKVS